MGKNTQSMQEQVYEYLRNGILMGELKPGEWLREQDISQKLGVSRIPIREAFRKLEQDRFIEHIPNRGARVTEVFTGDLGDIYDARIFVECKIARNAAERITDGELEALRKITEAYSAATEGGDIVRLAREFHEAIFVASRSEGLVAIIRFIGDLIVRIRHHNHLNPARRGASLLEHRAIYDALTKKDPDMVEQATRNHLESSKQFSLAQTVKPALPPRSARRRVLRRVHAPCGSRWPQHAAKNSA